MSSMRFRCYYCHRVHTVDSAAVGRRGQCVCGKTMIVPEGSSDPDAEAHQLPLASAPADGGQQVGASASAAAAPAIVPEGSSDPDAEAHQLPLASAPADGGQQVGVPSSAAAAPAIVPEGSSAPDAAAHQMPLASAPADGGQQGGAPAPTPAAPVESPVAALAASSGEAATTRQEARTPPEPEETRDEPEAVPREAEVTPRAEPEGETRKEALPEVVGSDLPVTGDAGEPPMDELSLHTKGKTTMGKPQLLLAAVVSFLWLVHTSPWIYLGAGSEPLPQLLGLVDDTHYMTLDRAFWSAILAGLAITLLFEGLGRRRRPRRDVIACGDTDRF